MLLTLTLTSKIGKTNGPSKTRRVSEIEQQSEEQVDGYNYLSTSLYIIPHIIQAAVTLDYYSGGGLLHKKEKMIGKL